MKILVSLDRLTALYAAYCLVVGRQVILLPNEQPSRPFGSFYGLLQKWIDRHPRSVNAVEDFPEIQKYLDIPGYNALINMFSKTEPCMNKHFNFDKAENNFKNYNLFYKHVTCEFSSRQYLTILFLHDVSHKTMDSDLIFVTPDKYLLSLYESYYEEKLKIKSKILVYPRSIVNFCIFLFVYLYSVLTIFRRIDWRDIKQETTLLGADFTEDNRNIEMVNELVDASSDCKYIYRSYDQFTSSKLDISNFSFCQMSDGFIPKKSIFASLRLLSIDCINIFLRAHQLQEEHFFQLIKAPIKRINFRALFNRYGFKYFWSRDDYNPEHIIRTQELRRVGAVSLGINHGFPNPQLFDPHWRYLDYDIYYTFGEYLGKTGSGDMWPKKMIIKAVGSLGMTREHFASLKNPRPNDIIFFAGPEIGEELIVQEVIKIAEAFPDKKVYVKNKREHLKSKVFDSGCKNLVDTYEDSYSLMFKAKYAVGGYSTVIAEAVQYGLCTYSFDVSGPDTDCVYRHFPDLCVHSGEEVIEKITAIESNKETYPQEKLSGLIHLSEPWGIEIIRQDMGLASRRVLA